MRLGGPAPNTGQYLAEGATGSFFETQFALLNPYSWPTTATMTFLKDTGEQIVRVVELPPFARRTLIASTVGVAAVLQSTATVNYQPPSSRLQRAAS